MMRLTSRLVHEWGLTLTLTLTLTLALTPTLTLFLTLFVKVCSSLVSQNEA